MAGERNVHQFDDDVTEHGGYLYTATQRLSSRLANERLTDLTLQMVSLEGLRVLDVGCGDGTYSHELFVRGRPARLLGVDAAAKAVESARRRFDSLGPGLGFEVQDASALPYSPGSFDVATVRGLLHHMARPEATLECLKSIARTVLIIEPNGYNPVLKLIERLSSYHRAHEEQSYAPWTLRRWVRATGGRLERSAYAGLVPFFCPDPAARLLKAVEPAVEALPVLRQLGCAVYALLYTTSGQGNS